MANPQLENGHTRIANETLEALGRIYLPPNQWQVLIVIIRKTYGFNKKVDWIANSQIGEATGLVKSTISRALRCLATRGIITRYKRNVGFQKDWEKWEGSRAANIEAKVSSTANSVKLAEPLTKVSNPASEKLAGLLTTKETTKETYTKEKTTKKPYGEFKNVLLTDQEYETLKARFSGSFENLIEKLSSYLASRGKHYKSHYATILNWQRREKEDKVGKTRNPRELPKTYAESPDYPDL